MPSRQNEDPDRSNDVDEEDYDENADDDFNPETGEGEGDISSSSDEDGEGNLDVKHNKAKPTSNKRKADDLTVELDSGDEATIKERKRRKRKAKDLPVEDEEDDDASGGENRGFVRTRAQRQAEKSERKQSRRVAGGAVTIDVEQIWLDLQNLPLGRALAPPLMPSSTSDAPAIDTNEENKKPSKNSPQTIKIKRRIEFAGEITEIEELVPRDSKEAQQYLRDHPTFDSDNPMDTDTSPSIRNGLRRPLKRLSIFEPNPAALVKGVAPERLRPRAPSRQDVIMMQQRAEELRKKKAEKMTTVQKSALDWRSFVDQQGFKEELDEYGKSRGTFLGREDFLDRAQGARDERAREARLKA